MTGSQNQQTVPLPSPDTARFEMITNCVIAVRFFDTMDGYLADERRSGEYPEPRDVTLMTSQTRRQRDGGVTVCVRIVLAGVVGDWDHGGLSHGLVRGET